MAEHEEASTKAWKPFPGPQTQAIESQADVIGFGGSAGGGKSSLLLGKASTQHRESVLFRKEYPELTEIIKQGQELFRGLAQFNRNDKVWRFDDGQRNIELSAVNHIDRLESQRGRPHDFIGIDEVTDWPEHWVRFLMGWNRTTYPGQKCQVVLTFNPPTSAKGQWVKKFFAPWLDRKHPRPADPGELRWFAVIPNEDGDTREIEVEDGQPIEINGETIHPSSRTFIPARVTDNPKLVGTDYVRKLQSLTGPLRAQLLYGNFDAGSEEDPWQTIPTNWVELSNERWRRDVQNGAKDWLQSSTGVDVARGGKDKSAIARRRRTFFDEIEVYPGKDTPTGLALAQLVIAGWDGCGHINVDAIGVGTACFEQLEALGADEAQPVNVSSRSEYTDRSGKYPMRNLRAEMYWRLREALDPENDPDELISLPPDSELLSDLCEPTYEITSAGIKIESKDDIKARIGRSPDKGDAVALAMLPEPMKAGGFHAGGEKTQIVAPYVGGRR